MPKTTTKIEFKTKLLRPAVKEDWMFLRLPIAASKKLPTRSMVSVEGTFNGRAFWTTLLPDGDGGHWMKVEKKLQGSAKPGDDVEFEISTMAKEPEPTVPPDLKKALASAPPKAMETWESITPLPAATGAFGSSARRSKRRAISGSASLSTR